MEGNTAVHHRGLAIINYICDGTYYGEKPAIADLQYAYILGDKVSCA